MIQEKYGKFFVLLENLLFRSLLSVASLIRKTHRVNFDFLQDFRTIHSSTRFQREKYSLNKKINNPSFPSIFLEIHPVQCFVSLKSLDEFMSLIHTRIQLVETLYNIFPLITNLCNFSVDSPVHFFTTFKHHLVLIF